MALRGAYYEITRTPPDERRRQERIEAEDGKAPVVLLPGAFGLVPHISFENIPLGKTVSRQLIIRNPSLKEFRVHFEKIPKSEKGFEFSHEDFDLGARSQATLEISWTPQNGSPLREIVILKLGSHKSQVNLVATCKCLPPQKIPKKKGPSSRSSVEAENSTSVSNFKSQRFFGPPVLSAIPDELVDVNPKRQTFAVKGSLSKVQLPIISTPVKDRETYLESKENILTGAVPTRPIRNLQPLKMTNRATFQSESNEMFIIPVETKIYSKVKIVQEKDLDFVNPDHLSKYPDHSFEKTNCEQLLDETCTKIATVDTEKKSQVCSETYVNIYDESSPHKIDSLRLKQDIFVSRLSNRTLEAKIGQENILHQIGEKCALSDDEKPDTRLSLSISLPDLNLTMSPDPKTFPKPNENVEETNLEESVTSISGRISSGTFVKSPCLLDDLRDLESLHGDLIPKNVIDTFVNTTNLLENIDETSDDISLLIANQMRLSSGQEPVTVQSPSQQILREETCLKEQYETATLEANSKESLSTFLHPIGTLPIKTIHKQNEENFLHHTITENSFRSPILNDLCYCSTGVKIKTKDESLTEKSSDIKRELFGSEDDTACDLPETEHNDSRLSSGTFIKSVEKSRLDTIEEESEGKSRQNTHPNKTFEKDSSNPNICSELDIQLPQTSPILSKTKSPDPILRQETKSNIMIEISPPVSNTASLKKPLPFTIKERTKIHPPTSFQGLGPEVPKAEVKNVKRQIRAAQVSTSDPSILEGFIVEKIIDQVHDPDHHVPKKSDTHTFGSISDDTVNGKTFFVEFKDAGGRECTKNFEPNQGTEIKKRSVSSMVRKSSAHEKRLAPALPNRKSTVFRPSVKQVSSRLTLLRPLTSSNGIVRHPNPFASKNMYYDERWIEKQENGFKKWLNFVLTPPDGFDCNENSSLLLAPGKIDVAKLWSACTKDVKVPRAPTREVLSMREYSARRQLRHLRRDAFSLWQSPSIAPVIIKLETEIEKQRIVIRADKQMNKDLGVKKKLLILMLSYNPLWLQIGLETVFGEILPIENLSDIVAISKFILTRFLSNPDILEQFAHPTVPYHYLPGYESALHQFTLKRFLQLVYFLDQAKTYRIIHHDPCLFNKDSTVKSSREMLTSFSRDFLSGEGDIIKHLAYLGYKVSHHQTPLDEFDYAVTNIAIDLRCGVRLCRLMEILTSDKTLSAKLRLPVVSRLQKVHNVDVALLSLKKSRAGLPENISKKDIVDGHMEKTLGLLWHVIFGFQLDAILDPEKLSKEIHFLEKSLEYRVRTGDTEAKNGLNFSMECKRRALKENQTFDTKDWSLSCKMKLLLQWARLVCAHYGLEVENFSVSFSDGRALCFMIHHYYPSFLRQDEITNETSQQQQKTTEKLNESLNDSFGITYNYGSGGTFDSKAYEKCLENERQNFKLLSTKLNELGGVPLIIRSSEMSNTIPDMKVTATFVAYLSARLIDLSKEMSAARTIQLAWKHHVASKREKALKVAIKAACVIQRRVRMFLMRQRIVEYTRASTVIQAWFRGCLGRKRASKEREAVVLKKSNDAAKIFQKYWRRALAIRRCERRRRSIVLIQSIFRMMIQRRKYLCTLKQVEMEKATVCFQKYWRGRVGRKEARRIRENNRILREKAAICFQKNWKMILQARKYNRIFSAAELIKSYLRAFVIRKKFKAIKKSVILLQSIFRGYKQRKMVDKKRQQILIVQSIARRFLAMKKVSKIRTDVEHQIRVKSAVKIQSCFKRYLAEKNYHRHRQHIILAQSCVRRFLAKKNVQQMKMAKERLLAAICLQKYFRSYFAKKQFQKLKKERHLLLCNAAALIQKNWKSFWARKKYLRKRNAAIMIQTAFRKNIAEQRYIRLRRSVLVLQSCFRGRESRRKIESYKRNIVVAQSFVRRFLAIKLLQRIRKENHLKLTENSAINIQKHWRRYQAQKSYKEACSKIVLIQSLVRGILARRRFRKLIYQKKLILATICLQKYWRSRLAREMLKSLQREHEDKRHKAAEIIQKNWKLFCQIRKYQRDRKRIIRIQSNFRRFAARKRYLLIKRSAVVIQSNLRGYFTRKKVNMEMKSIILAQSAIRRFLAKKLLLSLQKTALQIKLNQSAVVIQKNWKKFKALQNYRDQRCKVIIVQSIVRRFNCRRNFLRNLRFYHENKAATIIQNCWRSYFARLTLYKLKADLYRKRERAATLIQSKWKMIVQKNKYRRVLAGIIRLQSHVRGSQERRLFLKQKHAATVIQAVYRGWCQRKSLKEFARKVIIIQTLVRGYFARIKLVELRTERYLRKRAESALIIQKNWRMQKARKSYVETIQKTVILQSFFRMAISRKRYKNILRQREMAAAAVCIQKFWRAKTARIAFETLKVELQMKRNQAALVIQKNWKMHKQLRMYKKAREIIVWCQARIRSFIVRRRFLNYVKSATILQAHIRGHLQVKKYKCDLERIKKVQSYVRMYLAKLEVANMRRINKLKLLNLSAEIIQKNWKRYVCTKKYQHDLRYIVLVQSKVRCFLARRLFLRNLEIHREFKASICIQKYWRAKLAKNELRKLKNERDLQIRNAAATLIQKCWRGNLVRKKYLKTIHAVTRLQAQIRRWIARSRFVTLKKAVSTMKGVYRVKKAMRMIQDEKSKIILAQSVVRRFLAKRHVEHLKDEKRWHEFEVISAVRIQRAFRCHRLRLNLAHICNNRNRREKAAKLVQKTLLMWITRKQFLIKRRAATVIKAFWRGYSCRKRIKAEQRERLEQVRQRVDQAAKNATEEKKLCNRTVFAIDDLYTYKDMATLIAAVQSLEISTHYSTWCCSQLTENDCRGVKILAEILLRGNRSVPYQEVISRGFKVFLNIAEFEETRDQMCKVPSLFETVISCMQKNESNILIFCIGSALLWKLAQTKDAVSILLLPQYKKKLTDFEAKALSKSQRLHSTGSRQRASSDLTRVKSLSLRRNEHLGNSRVVRYHDNPAVAIKSLNQRIKFQTLKFKL